MPFDRYELEVIERALGRLVSTMNDSKFIGEDDPHFVKCKALRVKVAEMKKELA